MLIISLVLFQIVIFIGLIYMFKHILNRNVVLATKHLEELNQDYSKKEKDINRRLEEAKRKSEELLSVARNEAEKQRLDIANQAAAERDKILKEARVRSEEIVEQADRSRKVIIAELDERIAKEAINKACESIQNTLPEEFKQDVHSRWVRDLIEN
ncbi:MAG: hypothetical protein KJ952_03140, partial [Candidatus Omnitrophica bacterium]|nr:hypothetical protein [Candidatus Omnitrophota bacterium]